MIKAPDKIYIHVKTEPRPSITFSEALEKNSTNEEYIRKDALMEILATLKRSMANDTSYFALGATDAANILIDKINSM